MDPTRTTFAEMHAARSRLAHNRSVLASAYNDGVYAGEPRAADDPIPATTTPENTPDGPRFCEGNVALARGPEAAPGSSLDTIESSVKAKLSRNSARPVRFRTPPSPPPEERTSPLDESSWPARFRHAGWAPIRRRVWNALVATNQTHSRLSAFATCGIGSWVQRSDVDPTIHRVRTSCCHDRLCTPCANARAFRLKTALMAKLSGKATTFITLTLAHSKDDLTAMVDALYAGFRALRLHPLWKRSVTGGAAFLEIKWSDRARHWHPHLHIVCESSYMDQGKLSAAWLSVTDDSYIVDIRRVRDDAVSASYVTKYASKPLNASFMHDAALLEQAVLAMKSRRLCTCFGTWYGTPLDLEDDEIFAREGDLHAVAVHDGNWTNLMPLSLLLERAAEGDDADAVNLVRLCGIEGQWHKALNAGIDDPDP